MAGLSKVISYYLYNSKETSSEGNIFPDFKISIMKKLITISLALIFIGVCQAQKSSFSINSSGYFENGGVNVMVFKDFYPVGHQGGIGIIMHGKRVASDGDLRLDADLSGGMPISGQSDIKVDVPGNQITAKMVYPDPDKNKYTLLPVKYPDLDLKYNIKVHGSGSSVVITVDLEKPLPKEFAGKVGFVLELYPGILYGNTWNLDNKSGIFPRQANGPSVKVLNEEKQEIQPIASGRKLSVMPENKYQHMTIESLKGDLQLLDGRYDREDGWFIVRSMLADGAAQGAVEWIITPDAVPGWLSSPVVHVSQVGYQPEQEKKAIIELDKNDTKRSEPVLMKIDPAGGFSPAISIKTGEWGQLFRYKYLKCDFTAVKEEGMYIIRYGDSESQPFRIAPDVFSRDVWQPTIEYFLPVQMCHMKVTERSRTWHGLCHMDDALMAPVNHEHFDGYRQGESTYTTFKPGDHVPGLDVGGWHDAGDYDLRVESQSGEAYILSMIYEEFGINYDQTTIDQKNRIVEIHKPDGKPDVLQQIEHGVLSVIGGYKSMGRLYRGIIEATELQYGLLGDGSTATDGLVYDKKLKPGERTVTTSSVNDDRWVFTEDNPPRELIVASHLAASSRVLKGYNDDLSNQCLNVAEAIYNHDYKLDERGTYSKIQAASELFLTTGKDKYKEYLLTNRESVIKGMNRIGWVVVKTLDKINDNEFKVAVRNAAMSFSKELDKQAAETPFGVPYRPSIWGDGWKIQEFGVHQYFLFKAFPDVFSSAPVFDAMNFMLGVHPGENQASFASGVGAKSLTIAYGINRADGSYIPGGVAAGTALIRPDFPELLEWPFSWQQTEYVLGGGATNLTFLVLAADHFLEKK
jgi:endoglucanase